LRGGVLPHSSKLNLKVLGEKGSGEKQPFFRKGFFTRETMAYLYDNCFEVL
jgi:hypothetical protein